jgi:hypothetical protein
MTEIANLPDGPNVSFQVSLNVAGMPERKIPLRIRGRLGA